MIEGQRVLAIAHFRYTCSLRGGVVLQLAVADVEAAVVGVVRANADQIQNAAVVAFVAGVVCTTANFTQIRYVHCQVF